jgi:hypothetical protein
MAQTKEQRRRLARVFRWLEKNPERFDVFNWRTQNNASYKTFKSLESKLRRMAEDVKKCFESCGTSVCVGGAGVFLYPKLAIRKDNKVQFMSSSVRIFGVRECVLCVFNWGSANMNAYHYHLYKGDHAGMVAAARAEYVRQGYLDA